MIDFQREENRMRDVVEYAIAKETKIDLFQEVEHLFKPEIIGSPFWHTVNITGIFNDYLSGKSTLEDLFKSISQTIDSISTCGKENRSDFLNVNDFMIVEVEKGEFQLRIKCVYA